MCRSGNGVLATHQLLANSRTRLKNQVRVRVRVITYRMLPRGNLFDQIRARPRKFSDQKKCHAYGVVVEQIKEARSDGRVRAVVKRERERLGRCRVPNRRAEQFRRRANDSPRSHACSSRYASRHYDGPRIQFAPNAVNFRTAWTGIPAGVLVAEGHFPTMRLSELGSQ